MLLTSLGLIFFHLQSGYHNTVCLRESHWRIKELISVKPLVGMGNCKHLVIIAVSGLIVSVSKKQTGLCCLAAGLSGRFACRELGS